MNRPGYSGGSRLEVNSRMNKGLGYRISGWLACVTVVYALSSSADNRSNSPNIQINADAGPNPWSNLEFPDANSNFQFAIVSDNTGGAYPGVFEVAMTKLNLMQPEFVMSVGDLIEGYTTREQVVREWEEIESYVNTLDMP